MRPTRMYQRALLLKRCLPSPSRDQLAKDMTLIGDELILLKEVIAVLAWIRRHPELKWEILHASRGRQYRFGEPRLKYFLQENGLVDASDEEKLRVMKGHLETIQTMFSFILHQNSGFEIFLERVSPEFREAFSLLTMRAQMIQLDLKIILTELKGYI